MSKIIQYFVVLVCCIFVCGDAFAEIYKCNGSYQTQACKPGEEGGTAKLPEIKKYDWLKKDRAISPTEINSSKKEESKSKDARLAKEDKQKEQSRARLADRPIKEKKTNLTEQEIVKTRIRPRAVSDGISLIPSNKDEARLLALIQETSQFRFTLVDYAKRFGTKKAGEKVDDLWGKVESLCIEIASKKENKAREMCKRGFEDLVSLRNML